MLDKASASFSLHSEDGKRHASPLSFPYREALLRMSEAQM
jgi:hypothetical protein